MLRVVFKSARQQQVFNNKNGRIRVGSIANVIGQAFGVIASAAVLTGLVALVQALRSKPYPKVKRDLVIALGICIAFWIFGAIYK